MAALDLRQTLAEDGLSDLETGYGNADTVISEHRMVAALVAGENRAWDKVPIPAIWFTDPEIVAVGRSP